MNHERGLVIVLTGTGKGKTTSALGQALRAIGHNKRVAVIQFIKGSWKTGEMLAAQRLAPELLFIQMGRGFLGAQDGSPDPRDIDAAQDALNKARAVLHSGAYKMVILDELNYAVHYGLIAVEDVVALIDERPDHVHLVLTGAHAREKVVARANIVTEMVNIKHDFDKDTPAREGIEY